MHFLPFPLARFALALAIALSFESPRLRAGDVPTNIQAVSTQHPPGTPDGSTWNDFAAATIGDDGNISFTAVLRIPNNPLFGTALWRGSDGSYDLVVKRGDSTPGVANGAFSSLNFTLGNPGPKSVKSLGFSASIDVASVTKKSLWSAGKGGLSPIAIMGAPEPGGSTYEELYADFQMGRALDVVAFGGQSGGALPSLWYVDASTTAPVVKLVARTGDPAPEFGKYALPGPLTASTHALNGLGIFAFYSQVSDSPVVNGINQNQAIFLSDGDNVVPLVRNGEGVADIPGAIYSDLFLGGFTFDINSASNVVFTSRLANQPGHNGITSKNDFALFIDEHALLQSDDLVPFGASDEKFETFTTALIDLGAVVVDTRTYDGTTSRQRIVVFGFDGAYQLNYYDIVATSQEQAPGTEAGTVFSSLNFPSGMQFNDNLQVAFMATLSGPNIDFTNNLGIWGTDPDGNLLLVARTGDQIEIAPGDTRTIVDFERLASGGHAGPDDGRPKALNDDGVLVFCVKLSGSRSAIMRANLGSRPHDSTRANHIAATDDADPISTLTGELFSFETADLDLGGPMPLQFRRYYGSKIASDGNMTSALGRNRLHNFDASLTSSVDSTQVVLSNGRLVSFTKQNGKWELSGRTDIAYQLAQSGADFLLADPRSQRLWSFDADGKLTKIEDGRGNTHTLHYDDGANPRRLTSVTDDFNRTLAFTYDASGHLAKVRDKAADAPNPAVREVNFTYIGQDLVTATDALGHTTTYTYDANGQILSTQLPRGNVPYTQTSANRRIDTQTAHPASDVAQTTSLSYDTTTRQTTITDPVASRVHTYTATGELAELKDEAGKSITFSSDNTGRRSRTTDQLGRSVEITYHGPSGKPASVQAEDGAITIFAYSSRVVRGITLWDLTKTTFPDGTSRSFTYDGQGNLISATDQVGKVTTFAFDAHGQLLSVTNPTGGITSYTYDPATGNLATSKDSDTEATSYTYDAFSRLTRVTFPGVPPAGLANVDISYDDADRITSIIDERGSQFQFAYDANDNVTVITDPAAATIQLGYDALDRLVQVTNRLGKLHSQSFDSRDQLASVTDELGHVRTLGYDTRQRLTTLALPGGPAAMFDYDDDGRLIATRDALEHSRTLTRNERGTVVASSNSIGHTWQSVRDDVQRIARLIDPVGRQTAFSYDNRGSLVGTTRDGSGASSYTRDAAGRLSKVVDAHGAAWSYTYTPNGRLKSVTDPLGRTATLSYDSRGRMQTIELPDSTVCAVERDQAGEVTRVNCAGNPDLHFSYDALRRLTSANGLVLSRDAEGRITNSAQNGVNFGASYDDAGRLISVTYASGYAVYYQYDDRNRLIALNDNNGGASHPMLDFGYDNADKLVSIMRPGGLNATFTYDGAGRLTRIQDVVDIKYTLNGDGDIVSADLTAPLLPSVEAAPPQTFAFDAASQLVGTGFAYDSRGRLVKSPDHTYTWDGASRLRGYDGVALGYNGLGDIMTRSDGTTTTEYFHNYALRRAPIVAERTGLNFTRNYVWTPGGRLLFSFGDEGYVFYHCDRLGSALVLTNTTTNTQTDKYAYGPYGELLAHEGSSTQPFTFIGAFGVRTEGPLYQMRARYYDAMSAHFLSRDPGGSRLSDPRTLNPYLYALGNPARYVDPNGAAPTDPSLTDSLPEPRTGDAITAGSGLFGKVPYVYDFLPVIESGEGPAVTAAEVFAPKEVISTFTSLPITTAEEFYAMAQSGPEVSRAASSPEHSMELAGPPEGEPAVRNEAYVDDALESTGLGDLIVPNMQPLAAELAIAADIPVVIARSGESLSAFGLLKKLLNKPGVVVLPSKPKGEVKQLPGIGAAPDSDEGDLLDLSKQTNGYFAPKEKKKKDKSEKKDKKKKSGT